MKNYLTTETSFIPDGLFERFEKDLTNKNIIKAYCLPLFHFLKEYSFVIDGVREFDHSFVQSSSGLDRIAELKRLPKDIALPQETIELFELKFSKKNWKIPAKDLKRVKQLLQDFPEVIVHLTGIEKTQFVGVDGDLLTCLNPTLRYEGKR